MRRIRPYRDPYAVPREWARMAVLVAAMAAFFAACLLARAWWAGRL